MEINKKVSVKQKKTTMLHTLVIGYNRLKALWLLILAYNLPITSPNPNIKYQVIGKTRRNPCFCSNLEENTYNHVLYVKFNSLPWCSFITLARIISPTKSSLYD